MADTQTNTMAEKTAPHITNANTQERRAQRRALATSIAILWLSLLSSLALSLAQQAGQALGIPLPKLLPGILLWATHQSLLVQLALGLLMICITVGVIWFTIWAWGASAAAQQQATEEAIVTEDHHFERRIEPVVQQGQVIAVAVETGRSEAAQHASASEERDAQLRGGIESARQESRQQNEEILQQGKVIEKGVQEVTDQITSSTARKYTILPASELNVASGFNLGRPSAASFPYYEKPFKGVLSQAAATLSAIRDSDTSPSDTLGIVVVGKADAGKTRLALKTLYDTLPEWTALVWSTIYQAATDLPSPNLYAGCDLILILDDLQDYGSGSQALAGAGSLLRTLLGSLRQAQSVAGRKFAVVATCRAENLAAVRASFGWLLSELDLVRLPEFSPDANNPESAGVIADLKRRGRVFPQDWNGRIGSLVLGIEVTREQYALLDQEGSPAIPVLCAMKLLARAGVSEHTFARIRAICAEILGEIAIREELRVWRRALDDLESREFVRRQQAAESDDEALVILRGNDFKEVITCYGDRDSSLAHDRDELLWLFSRLGDIEALFYLGSTYYAETAYTQALIAYEQATTLDPTLAQAWTNKGNALAALNRYDEALTALEQATTLDPTDALAWYNKGVTLAKLNRYDKALIAYEQATTLDPTLAQAWTNKGNALAALNRYDEALTAYEQATTLDPTDAQAWTNKGNALAALNRYDKALIAYEQATTLDPTLAQAWYNKGNALAKLNRYDKALIALEQATTLDPTLAQAWTNKGNALAALNRYDEALTAYEQALACSPDEPVFPRK